LFAPTSTVSGSVTPESLPASAGPASAANRVKIIRELGIRTRHLQHLEGARSTPRPLGDSPQGVQTIAGGAARLARASVPLVGGCANARLDLDVQPQRAVAADVHVPRPPDRLPRARRGPAGPGAHPWAAHGWPHVHQAGACARGAWPPRDRGRHARPRSLGPTARHGRVFDAAVRPRRDRAPRSPRRAAGRHRRTSLGANVALEAAVAAPAAFVRWCSRCPCSRTRSRPRPPRSCRSRLHCG